MLLLLSLDVIVIWNTALAFSSDPLLLRAYLELWSREQPFSRGKALSHQQT